MGRGATLTGGVLLVALCLVAAPGARRVDAQERQLDADNEAAAEEKYAFTGIDIEVGEASLVPVNGDHLLIPGPEGQPREVPVELVAMPCSYQVQFTVLGKAYHQSAPSQLLYELRSGGAVIPYTKTLFFRSRASLGGLPRDFALVTFAPGENYLAWVDGDEG